jgi:hypothetical protein
MNTNIYEKIGDFLLNMVQLVFGGIIFTLVMSDKGISSILLYVISAGVIVLMFTFAIILYCLGKKRSKL